MLIQNSFPSSPASLSKTEFSPCRLLHGWLILLLLAITFPYPFAVFGKIPYDLGWTSWQWIYVVAPCWLLLMGFIGWGWVLFRDDLKIKKEFLILLLAFHLLWGIGFLTVTPSSVLSWLETTAFWGVVLGTATWKYLYPLRGNTWKIIRNWLGFLWLYITVLGIWEWIHGHAFLANVGNPNWTMSWYLVLSPWAWDGVAAILSHKVKQLHQQTIQIIAGLIILLFLIIFLFYSGHRAGIVTIGLTTIFILIYVYLPPSGRWKTFILGISLSLAFAIFLLRQTDNNTWESLCYEIRIPLYQTALQMCREKPWIGWGPDAFRRYSSSYRPLSYHAHPYATAYSNHPHNEFLNLAVQYGICAAVLWLTLFIGTCWYGRIHHRFELLARISVVIAFLSSCFDLTLQVAPIQILTAFFLGTFFPAIARPKSPSTLFQKILLSVVGSLGVYLFGTELWSHGWLRQGLYLQKNRVTSSEKERTFSEETALKVIQAYLKTETIRGWQPQALYEIASCAIQTKNAKFAALALQYLKLLEKQYPHYAHLHMLKGMAYEKLGNKTEALKEFRLNTQLFPLDPQVWFYTKHVAWEYGYWGLARAIEDEIPKMFLQKLPAYLQSTKSAQQLWHLLYQEIPNKDHHILLPVTTSLIQPIAALQSIRDPLQSLLPVNQSMEMLTPEFSQKDILFWKRRILTYTGFHFLFPNQQVTFDGLLQLHRLMEQKFANLHNSSITMESERYRYWLWALSNLSDWVIVLPSPSGKIQAIGILQYELMAKNSPHIGWQISWENEDIIIQPIHIQNFVFGPQGWRFFLDPNKTWVRTWIMGYGFAKVTGEKFLPTQSTWKSLLDLWTLLRLPYPHHSRELIPYLWSGEVLP